jgi:hypothetical protein
MSCGLPYIYNYFLSGDCSNTNSGVISFDISGGTGPYAVSEATTTGLLPLSASTSNYYFSGLSAGTYTLSITDSCVSPTPTIIYVPFVVSSGSCLSSSITNTTCGFNNGTLTATFSPYYGTGSVSLYETTVGYISSASTLSSSTTFLNLSGGTYYVIGDDGGGCTGKSESCIIKSSTTLDFGYYVINDGSCVALDGAGKIFITGQTGTPPYTYVWSSNANGQTGSTVTGLTAGNYGVTVTDSLGCTKIDNSIVISEVLPVGIVNLTTVSPSCFSNDGEVFAQLTGGTSPFYFSGSNGTVGITFANNFTFTGLSTGTLTVSVTDAGLCTALGVVSLLTPNGFSIANISTINSNCNNNDGQINIVLNGGTNSGTYIYTLIDSSGNTVNTATLGTTCDFTNVSSGVYTIKIENGTCVFTGTTTVSNTNLYTISASTTGTTCGFDNGSIQIIATSGGTLPYTYQITGQPAGPVTTFNNLAQGFYNITVTDGSGCQQYETVYLNGSSSMYFDLFVSQPLFGNDGEISTLISSGEPPFTLNWSSNVNGQTGTTVTGLTAGTYSLQVIDDNGCVFTRTTTLVGTTQYVTYQSYNVCSQDFANTGVLGKRGILQMLYEGYFDLTSGDTNCVLNSAIFTADVTVNGVDQQSIFYTSTGFDDVPTDNDWVTAITNLLYTFGGISSVLVNLETNQIIITSGCQTEGEGCQTKSVTTLDDANVKISLNIDYDISCVECEIYQKVFQDDFEFIFQDDNSYIFQ